MRGRRTSPELRAKAEALLLEGLTQQEVCDRTGLDKAIVSRLARSELFASDVQRIATRKTESLDQLILAYLTTGFRALIAQAEVFADVEYCSRQDADKLAIAHGVVADKLAGVAATAQALGLFGQPVSPALGPGGDE